MNTSNPPYFYNTIFNNHKHNSTSIISPTTKQTWPPYYSMNSTKSINQSLHQTIKINLTFSHERTITNTQPIPLKTPITKTHLRTKFHFTTITTQIISIQIINLHNIFNSTQFIHYILKNNIHRIIIYLLFSTFNNHDIKIINTTKILFKHTTINHNTLITKLLWPNITMHHKKNHQSPINNTHLNINIDKYSTQNITNYNNQTIYTFTYLNTYTNNIQITIKNNLNLQLNLTSINLIQNKQYILFFNL